MGSGLARLFGEVSNLLQAIRWVGGLWLRNLAWEIFTAPLEL